MAKQNSWQGKQEAQQQQSKGKLNTKCENRLPYKYKQNCTK